MSAPLTHRIEGAGPPVVLINGGMMTFAAWEPIAAALRARYQVLRFDFRGQLMSPGAPPTTLAGHAADLRALLDTVGWPSAHLVGTSFGAEVALELASTAAELAQSLTLITAMDRETGELRRQSDEMRGILAEVLAGGPRDHFYDVLVQNVYSEGYRRREAATFAARRGQMGVLPPSWFAGVDALLLALQGFDLTAQLAAVRCPTRVVIAAEDRVMEPERSRTLAAALGADLVVHPTSGHVLVLEDPAWLAAACLNFLDRVAQEPVAGPSPAPHA